MDQELDAVYRDFHKKFCHYDGQLTSFARSKEQQIDEYTKELNLMLLELGQKLEQIRQYSDRTRKFRDFISVQKEIQKMTEEKERSRTVLMEKKESMQATKVTLQEKVKLLKNEIDELQERNLQMESELSCIIPEEEDEQLPLILKLMSSKSRNRIG